MTLKTLLTFSVAFIVVTLMFHITTLHAIDLIQAKLDTTYTIDFANTEAEPTGIYLSPEYQFDDVFGPVTVNDNFDNVQVFFEQLYNDTSFNFKLNLVSGKVLQPTATFGKLKLSMTLLDNPVERVLFRFNAENGIWNVDLMRHMQAYFINPTTSLISELTVLGDQFGVIRRFPNMFEVDLNLPYLFQAIGNTEFELLLYTEDSPLDPTPLVDYRYIEVPYAASYAMKLESNPGFSRYFTIGFPAVPPVNYMIYQSPRFLLTEANNIRLQDIVDPRFKWDEIVILKSYLFEADRGMVLDGSYINYDYIYDDLNDVAGEEVEIKYDTVTCASTYGNGYAFGTPITPGAQSIDSPGRVTCSSTVIVPNSLIVIYAKVVMYKRPKIDAITNGERVESQVSRGFGKYSNVGPITKDTCVTFKGSVSKNPLSIYMLQQEFSKNRDYASQYYYTQVAILPIGNNVEAKFCSNETIFKEVGKLEQEMDFTFISATPETVSEFVLISSVSDGSSSAGAVIGALFAVGIVFAVCGGLITAGIVFWWKKKRVNYDAIN